MVVRMFVITVKYKGDIMLSWAFNENPSVAAERFNEFVNDYRKIMYDFEGYEITLHHVAGGEYRLLKCVNRDSMHRNPT
jgi:hypothetical protein